MAAVHLPPAGDRTVHLTVGPSGGWPDGPPGAAPPDVPAGSGGTPGAVRVVWLAGDMIFHPALARRAMLGALGRRLVHWLVFRGGWTVYVDAPDRDLIKIRCAGREDAEARAGRLAERIRTHGEAALDGPYR
jgi:hypothetical protein